MSAQTPIYGLMAEFDDVTTLVDATKRVHAEGYKRFDVYTPFPVHQLFDAMEFDDRRLPLIVLLGGIAGCFAGFGLCYWVSTTAYPLNIGGRPFNSWPAFIPVTFEVTILFAALTCVFGMIVLNGLPQPYHPVFNVKKFAERGSQDALFLAIEADDPRFDREKTRAFLQQLGAREINEVEP
ncbi:MAG TPA: DUF3341 domain-containing protein [Vicinamibacterales bacterium]